MTTELAEAPVAEPPVRRRRLVAAVAVVVVLAGLTVLAWEWRHPHAFSDVGDEIGFDRGTPGAALYFAVTMGPEGEGTVSIHDWHARFTHGSAAAATELVVCTYAPTASPGALGAGSQADLDELCASVNPAAGATYHLGTDVRQQLLLMVVPAGPGDVEIDGVDLDYSHGWQRGTQTIGFTYTVHTP